MLLTPEATRSLEIPQGSSFIDLLSRNWDRLPTRPDVALAIAANTRISRRGFLTALGIAGAVAAVPEIAAAEVIGQEAAFRRQPFNFYPGGSGLTEIVTKFTVAHSQETGEPWSDVYENRMDKFVQSLRRMVSPAQGICNGSAMYEALKLRETPEVAYLGGQAFSRQEINAVGGVWMYGQAKKPENFYGRDFPSESCKTNRLGRNEPNFILNMVWEYIVNQGVPVVIDRSPNYSEVWSHVIDAFNMDITRQGNRARVGLTLYGPNYVEPTGIGLPISAIYDVEEGNIWDPGVQVGGSVINTMWRPAQGMFYAGYQIEDNVMSKNMLESLRKLSGHTPDEWAGMAYDTPPVAVHCAP